MAAQAGDALTSSEGRSLDHVVVARFRDPNLLAKASDFTATITWTRDHTNPGGGHETISDPGETDFTRIIATSTPGLFEVVAGYVVVNNDPTQVAVDIKDAGDSSTRATASAAVRIRGSSIRVTASPLNGIEGQTLPGGTVIATFTDTNGKPAAEDYAATLDWGTGQHTVQVSADPTSAQPGHYQVTADDILLGKPGSNFFTVMVKRGTHTSIGLGNLAVNDAPLSATAPDGGLYGTALDSYRFHNVLLASFSDAAANSSLNDFGATIAWADGQNTSAIILQTGPQTYNVYGAHTYHIDNGSNDPNAANYSAGQHWVYHVEIDDKDGAAAEADGNVWIGESVPGDGYNDRSNDQDLTYGGGVLPTPYNPAGNGGDGGGTDDQDPQPTSGDAGQLNATGLDVHGGTLNSPSDSMTGDLAHFSDDSLSEGQTPTLTGYSAQITFDNGTTAAGTITADTMGDDNFQMAVSAVYPTGKAGDHSAQIVITGPNGSVSVQSIIHVKDNALDAQGENEHTHETLGHEFTLKVASFTFANSYAVPADFTATIYWGDDTTSTGDISVVSSGFEVKGTHTYAPSFGDSSPAVTVHIAHDYGVSTGSQANHASTDVQTYIDLDPATLPTPQLTWDNLPADENQDPGEFIGVDNTIDPTAADASLAQLDLGVDGVSESSPFMALNSLPRGTQVTLTYTTADGNDYAHAYQLNYLTGELEEILSDPGDKWTWVVGTDIVPDAVWVQGTHNSAPRQVELTCTIEPPTSSIRGDVDGDEAPAGASTTPPVSGEPAKATVGGPDLDIYDGEYSTAVSGGVHDSPVPENEKNSIGAFTVDNQNDTDGDSNDDLLQNNVPGEVDLMKLVIHAIPGTQAGQTQTLKVNPAQVTLWGSQLKGRLAVPMTNGLVTGIPANVDTVFWVEALKPSTKVGDIRIRDSFNGASDTVKATAIWAQLTNSSFANQSPSTVDAALGLDWKANGGAARDFINPTSPADTLGLNGTGVDANLANHINAMVMQFTVTPNLAGVPVDRAPSFCLITQMRGINASWGAARSYNVKAATTSDYPLLASIDNPSSAVRSPVFTQYVSPLGNLWAADFSSAADPTATLNADRENRQDFLAVHFAGATTTPTLSSRVSGKYAWYTESTSGLVSKPGIIKLGSARFVDEPLATTSPAVSALPGWRNTAIMIGLKLSTVKGTAPMTVGAHLVSQTPGASRNAVVLDTSTPATEILNGQSASTVVGDPLAYSADGIFATDVSGRILGPLSSHGLDSTTVILAHQLATPGSPAPRLSPYTWTVTGTALTPAVQPAPTILARVGGIWPVGVTVYVDGHEFPIGSTMRVAVKDSSTNKELMHVNWTVTGSLLPLSAGAPTIPGAVSAETIPASSAALYLGEDARGRLAGPDGAIFGSTGIIAEIVSINPDLPQGYSSPVAPLIVPPVTLAPPALFSAPFTTIPRGNSVSVPIVVPSVISTSFGGPWLIPPPPPPAPTGPGTFFETHTYKIFAGTTLIDQGIVGVPPQLINFAGSRVTFRGVLLGPSAGLATLTNVGGFLTGNTGRAGFGNAVITVLIDDDARFTSPGSSILTP